MVPSAVPDTSFFTEEEWIDLTDDYTVAPFYSDDLEHAVDDTGMVMFVAGIDEDAGMIFRHRVPLERIL